MKYLLVILLFLLIQSVCATCSGSQIDINSASLKELDKLAGIGEVKAQAIIDERPFGSVDDLIDVYGIGEATLEKILDQGLACVSREDEKDKREDDKKEETKEIFYEEEFQGETIENLVSEEVEKPVEVIKLNSKDIKTNVALENITESSNSHYTFYGLFGFCVLLGLLFGVKKLKRNKNEFD